MAHLLKCLHFRTGRLARVFAAVTFASAILAMGTDARAEDPRIMSGVAAHEISPVKRTLAGLYLHADEAKQYLETYSDIVLIDVRPSKFVKLGALEIAHAHLPILEPSIDPAGGKRAGTAGAAGDGVQWPKMKLKADFVARVEQLLKDRGRDRRTGTVILFCGAGMFSARASDLLTESGFANVYAIIDGFSS